MSFDLSNVEAKGSTPRPQTVTSPRPARTRAAVELQGYRGLSDAQIEQIEPWLRVAPAFEAGWTVVATLAGSAGGLLLVAVISAAGTVMPVHPFDLPYNLVIRHWVRGAAIPRSAGPRRFASAVSALWLGAAAAAFASGARLLGLALGGSFVLLSLIPVVTGTCLIAWLWSVRDRRRDGSALREQAG